MLILGKLDSPISQYHKIEGKKIVPMMHGRTIDDIHKCHVNVFKKKGIMIMQVPFLKHLFFIYTP